jgi:hypothetical protein
MSSIGCENHNMQEITKSEARGDLTSFQTLCETPAMIIHSAASFRDLADQWRHPEHSD